AGVGQLEEAEAGLDERGEAVARDAGRGIDNGDALARQPVEERRLADVGSADDGNHGDGHGSLQRTASEVGPSIVAFPGPLDALRYNTVGSFALFLRSTAHVAILAALHQQQPIPPRSSRTA